MKSKFYQAKFRIEEGNVVSGYTTGERWNGWARPHFEKEAILEWLRVTGNRYDYDADTDTINVYMYDTGDLDSFSGYFIEVDGKTIKVYPVGAGCWIWDEV